MKNENIHEQVNGKLVARGLSKIRQLVQARTSKRDIAAELQEAVFALEAEKKFSREAIKRAIEERVLAEREYRESMNNAIGSQEEMRKRITALEGQLSALDAKLKASTIEQSRLLSELKEAQARRSGHWNKYELERKKNLDLSKKIAALEKDNRRMLNSLTWALGSAVLKAKTIRGFLLLPVAILAAVKSYRAKISATNQAKIKDNAKPAITINGGAAEERTSPSSQIADATATRIEPKKPETKAPFKHIEPKPAREMKVALICDEFTYHSFAPEFNPIVLDPEQWREQMDAEQPDLLLCESAWSGVDSKARPWKGKIYASANFKEENRRELIEILAYCGANGIKTAFWNKEDPTHFTDRKHDFVKTAVLFDYVFTTAAECIEQYKDEYGCKNVACLPFATQPKMFNPIEVEARTNDVVFAGSWYANHIERSANMASIFDAIIKSRYSLVIYDRFYGDKDPNHQFPNNLQKFTKPNVPFEKVASVYKSSRFGLTINTVKESTTMFARRAFELMSSNTLVLTNHSRGLHAFFDGLVVDLEKNPNGLDQLDQQAIERMRRDALHCVLEKHTYAKRFEQMLSAMDVPYIADRHSVTVVIHVSSTSEVEQAISCYRKLAVTNSKLLIILGTMIADIDLAPLYSTHNKGTINLVAESYIKKYMDKFNEIIETSHFALIEPNSQLMSGAIDRALLHYSYLEDDLIALNQGIAYQFFDAPTAMNIIGKRGDFRRVIDNINGTIDCRAYSLSSAV